tara:strand:- start:96 stop:1271 length:1176 start_codon:yes stop_codon:yes gene_type:complete
MSQSVASTDVSESDAGEEGSGEIDVLSLAMRALQNLKTAIESDSVRAHKRAVGKLCRLKLRLEASDELAKDVAQVLVSAGAIVSRAVTFAKNDDDANDLGITLSLLFGLVILCRTCPAARNEEELEGLKATLTAYDAFCIAGDREGYVPHHVAAGALLRQWSTPDGVAPTAIARHAAQRFFRSTSAAMFLSKILEAADDDDDDDDAMFCSLSVGAVLEEANPEMKEKRLQGIVDGADSEVGQQVLRDLILSFLLPRELLGTRKTLLLTREASKRAGVEHGLLLSQAHDAAMRGAPWSYSDDENEIHKICALLAGLAMLQLAKAKNADVRLATPFDGLVQIGFLELTPCTHKKRLVYDEEVDTWRVYSQSPLTVHARGVGLDGLRACVLDLV